MKNSTKKFWKKTWQLAPFLIAVAMVITVVVFWFEWEPEFVNYLTLETGILNEVQKHSISMVTEINKFLVSITTLLFGALGFYLINYRKQIKSKWVAVSYFISLILLGFADYMAFRVYEGLLIELGDNVFGLTPYQSRVIYFLRIEFWAAFGSSLILLFIFLFVFIEKK